MEKRIVHLTRPITVDSLKNTFVVGSDTRDFLQNLYENEDLNLADLKLTVGAVIAELLRAEVYKKTGYRCSAGIAHNKILAKQACGINKPNKQTILPHSAIKLYYQALPVHKITGLGGKFGVQLGEKLGIQFMGQLRAFSEKELAQKFDEKMALATIINLQKFVFFTAIVVFRSWLYNIARGIDLEPVTARLVSKSIGCCKKFAGKAALLVEEDVRHWLHELTEELVERLEQDQMENNRKARQIIISFAQQINKKDVSSSRTTTLSSYDTNKIFEDAFEVIRKFCCLKDGGFHLKFLGLSAGHFEDMKNVREITSFFKVGAASTAKPNENLENSVERVENPGPSSNQKSQVHADDEDSISSELFSSNDAQSNDATDTSSFFVNYLSSIQKGNVERNFNTSKILEEDVQSTSSEEKTCTEATDARGKITCEECGKSILMTEIAAHNDYHYALKIVKSEAGLYKQIANQDSKKRKLPPEQEKVTTLTKFFQNQISDDGSDGELCAECNKRVRLEEVESHRDYHVAKKLHQEINSSSKVSPLAANSAKRGGGKTKSKRSLKTKGNLGKIRPVTSFFKPA